MRVARDLVLLVDEPYTAGSADSVSDCTRDHRPGDTPEAMLADKYLDLTLPACLAALGRLGAVHFLHWPRQIGWVTDTGSVVQFHSGPNPHLNLPPIKRITAGGNASIAVLKAGGQHARSHKGLRPLARSAVMAML